MENLETRSKTSEFVSKENNFEANLIDESEFTNFHLKRKNEELHKENSRIKETVSKVF